MAPVPGALACGGLRPCPSPPRGCMRAEAGAGGGKKGGSHHFRQLTCKMADRLPPGPRHAGGSVPAAPMGRDGPCSRCSGCRGLTAGRSAPRGSSRPRPWGFGISLFPLALGRRAHETPRPRARHQPAPQNQPLFVSSPGFAVGMAPEAALTSFLTVFF